MSQYTVYLLSISKSVFPNIVCYSLVSILFITLLIVCKESLGLQELCFVIVLFIIITYLASSWQRRSIRVEVSDLLVTVYFIAIIPWGSNIHMMQITSLFILFIIARNLIADLPSYYIIIMISIIGLCESLIGIMQLLGLYTSYNYFFQVTGTFYNPGPFGCFLTTIDTMLIASFLTQYRNSPIISYKPINSKQINKLTIMAIPATSIAIILSNSRTAILSLFIAVCCQIFSYRWSLYRQSIKRVCNCIIIFAIIVVSGLLLYNARPQSADSRLLTWKILIFSDMTTLINGVGSGEFKKYYSDLQTTYYNTHKNEAEILMADTKDYAFNEYLEFCTEFGLVKLIIGLIIVLYIFRRQTEWFVKCGTIAILAMSMTSYVLHVLPIQILFVILLCRHSDVQVRIKVKYKNIYLFVFVVFSTIVLYLYSERIIASIEWEKQKLISDISFIEIRDLSTYKKLDKSLHDNPSFLLDYGLLLFRNNNIKQSIDILQEGDCLSNNPSFPLLIGIAYEQIQCYKEAETMYWNAFNRLPNRMYPLYRLALLYSEKKQYERFDSLIITLKRFKPKIENEKTIQMRDEINALKDAMMREKE